MGLEEVGDKTYAVVAEGGDSNFGLIVSDEGVIVVDGDVRRWNEIQRYLDQVTSAPVALVIDTHDNFDHTSANSLFRDKGAIIMATVACKEILNGRGREEFQQKLADGSVKGLDLGKLRVCLPQIAITGPTAVEMGNKLIEVIPVGHAHTPGDLVVFLPHEGVLFAGDVVFSDNHPVMRNGDVFNWMRIMDTLKGLSISTVVPGHGPIGGSELIDGFSQYLRFLVGQVQEQIDAGADVEEVLASTTFPERYKQWGKTNWIPTNLRRIYEQLTSEKNGSWRVSR